MAASTPTELSSADRIPGEFMGEVFSNPLDNYDLSQFTTHLYMAENNDPTSQNIYTISRTGVTDTILDNLNIKTYTNGVAAGEVTFTLTQPGRVGLIDEMMSAQRSLGLPQAPRTIVFLDINFIGYSSDVDDQDRGGELKHIAGPYRYKLFIAKLGVSISAEGSTYDVATIMHNYYAYTDLNIFRMPGAFEMQPDTIFDGLKKLQDFLQKFYKESQKSYEFRDEFEFDTTDATVAPYFKQTLRAEPKVGVYPNAGLGTTQRITIPAEGETPSNQSQPPVAREENIQVEGTRITIREGATIDAVIRTMFGLCPEFRADVTKRTNPDDPESTEVTQKDFLKWIKIQTNVHELRYDKKRKDYQRRFTYSIVVFKTARTDIDIPESHQDTAKGKISNIVAEGLIKKAYYYIFTGKNDQILNLDIKFDNGAALLNQPTAHNNPSAALAQGQSGILPQERRSGAIPTATPATPSDSDPPSLPLVQPAGASVSEADSRQRRPVIQLPKVPDFQEGGSYYGFSNTIFGHLAFQHHLTSVVGSSLIDLNMTVRGDPWYLGKHPDGSILENRGDETDVKKSYANQFAGCFMRDHTFMILVIGTPRYPNDNSDDEDLGTGYWSQGLSRSFSGLYLIREVSNSFTGGIFTSEIRGHLMIEYGVDEALGLMSAEVETTLKDGVDQAEKDEKAKKAEKAMQLSKFVDLLGLIGPGQ